MPKRGESGLSLLLGVDKPVGMSSHDVVNRIRSATGEMRVGHFGTLDPLASGVMLVGVGPAVRLGNYLVEHDKEYVADIRFGEERNTDDAEGEVVVSAAVPETVADRAFAQDVLSRFSGVLEQVPPAFSAIKQGGVTAYKAARTGETLDLPARSVEVFQAELLAVSESCWQVRFRVSKGTYIRALARDIGRAVGCGAYLGGLRREQLGSVSVADCLKLDELTEQAKLRALNPVEVLGFPHLEVLEADRKILENGGALAVPAQLALRESAGNLVSVLCDNRLKAIYRVDEGATRLKCDCLFSIGVDCG